MLETTTELDRVDGRDEIAFVSVVDPTPAEMARLVEVTGASPELIEHALDEDELPRVHQSGDVTLVVLRVPVFRGEGAPKPYVTAPLGLVLAPRHVVAICRSDNQVLRALRERVSAPDVEPMHRLVLHALELSAEAYLRELRRINERVDRLEAQLESSLGNREVLELLRCQKSFVYFATALRGMELVLEHLPKNERLEVPETDRALFDEVLVEVRQAIDMTGTSANVLGEMMDAFASIISNNLNTVMKLLAAITVVFILPVLIASFYGMNVTLPGARSPFAFVALVGVSVIASLPVAWLFHRRRWL